MTNYQTNYPSNIILDDGTKIQLSVNDNQNRVIITETDLALEQLRIIFEKEGFNQTILEEKKPNQIAQGLMKKLTEDWDMHVRFLQFHRGLVAVDAEVETSREYLDHIGGRWVSVVYEVINIFQKYGTKFYFWHKYAQKYVKEIQTNVNLILNDISGKIEWKPIAAGVGIGLTLLLLVKLLSDYYNDKDRKDKE